MTRAEREALWELLSGSPADEDTTAASVYPPAVLGPAVAKPAIVRRVWPATKGDRRYWDGRSGLGGKKKRKKKKLPMESIFPHSTAAK